MKTPPAKHYLKNVHCPGRQAINSSYLTTQEDIDFLQKHAGDAEVLLFQHYLRVASSKEERDFLDARAARALAWNERKVQRVRLKLEQLKYYKYVVYRRHDGVYGVDFHVGPHAVEQVEKYNQEKNSESNVVLYTRENKK